MTLRTILVPVRGDGKGETVLDHALALARPFSAHLRVVHCRPRPEDLLPYGVYAPAAFKQQITASATGLADDEERRVRALFDAYCARHDVAIVEAGIARPRDRVSASWEEATGKQAAVVAVRGRLADVIAVAQPDRKLNLGQNTLEAVLLETGRLVLLCPPVEVTGIGRHVAIGWNGSAEASRAVAAALDVLTAADQVTVLAATTGERIELTPEDLKRYLSSHDIDAAIDIFAAEASEVGQGLLRRAEAAGADVLLLGAYGQSRRRALVMGGVTQHVIEQARLPVLLVH